jgi:hypothetical protein
MGDSTRQHSDAFELLDVPRLGLTRFGGSAGLLLLPHQLFRQTLGCPEVRRPLSHSRFQLGVQGPDLPGHSFVLGDIPSRPADLVQTAGVSWGRRIRQLDIRDVTVTRLHLHTYRSGAAVAWNAGDQAAKTGAVLIGDVSGESFPGQKPGRDFQQRRRGLVRLNDDARAVGHQIRIRSEFEEALVLPALDVELDVGCGELFVLLPQLLFGNS